MSRAPGDVYFPKTYAAPSSLLLSLAPLAPETIVLPLMLTEIPKLSSETASDGLSVALGFEVVFHPPTGLVKTYARPSVTLEP